MRDHRGLDASAMACPLGENFRNYLSDMYASYAELGFDTIWIEDDFRLHNHAPLSWGGWFCDAHMERFSRAAGQLLEREDFVRGLLSTGSPHPYRKIWLDIMGETMVEFAELLEAAIHRAAPNTRIALMSSRPQAHAVEGRDWEFLTRILSGDHRALNRPHLPAYHEKSTVDYRLHFHRISRLAARVIPTGTELWPELDNFPHTTFSKSHRFAAMGMESTLALGAEGIAINIFDMMGNGIAPLQENHRYLTRLKPHLDAVTALGLESALEQGAAVMVSPDSSRTLHVPAVPDSDEAAPALLEPRETFWGEYLSAFGIAYHYETHPNPTSRTVALSGQYLRNLSPEAAQRLLEADTVLVDAESLEILLEMGLDGVPEIRNTRWFEINRGGHSYEQALGPGRWRDLAEARMSCQAIHEGSEKTDGSGMSIVSF